MPSPMVAGLMAVPGVLCVVPGIALAPGRSGRLGGGTVVADSVAVGVGVVVDVYKRQVHTVAKVVVMASNQGMPAMRRAMVSTAVQVCLLYTSRCV